ncbi:MAG: 4Fe-4S binding protein [Dehalococcoidales bacterium]|jgi:NAD-dependent dihydropyrimidine dehydrogenase PreA subunit
MDNENSIYRALQQHLDKSPVGFPATKSGGDIALLKQLFTATEAQIAVCLSNIKLEPAERIYRLVKQSGLKIPLDELKKSLDIMVHKGTILVYSHGTKEKHYKNAGVTAGGIVDFQVNRMTKELSEVVHRYHTEAFAEAEMTGTRSIPQLRTVPVAKSIPTPDKHAVATYDDVHRLLDDAQGPFAVANCICRQTKDMSHQPCKYSDIRETCLQIGTDHARQYVEMGIARYVSKEEALEILEKAQQAGFILQPENSQRPEAICCCCGDCCMLLSSVKKAPRPADMYASNYFVSIDPALCKACGACVKRCQLEARALAGGVSTVNLDRCIGCGNCVITCETGATRLIKKDTTLVPPKDKDAEFMKIMSDKVGRWNMIKLRMKMMLGMRE